MEEYKRGDTVVCKFGWDHEIQKPYEFLYDFGYYTNFGCVVYTRGECNMQDASAYKLYQVRKATEEDMNNLTWGD